MEIIQRVARWEINSGDIIRLHIFMKRRNYPGKVATRQDFHKGNMAVTIQRRATCGDGSAWIKLKLDKSIRIDITFETSLCVITLSRRLKLIIPVEIGTNWPNDLRNHQNGIFHLRKLLFNLKLYLTTSWQITSNLRSIYRNSMRSV